MERYIIYLRRGGGTGRAGEANGGMARKKRRVGRGRGRMTGRREERKRWRRRREERKGGEKEANEEKGVRGGKKSRSRRKE